MTRRGSGWKPIAHRGPQTSRTRLQSESQAATQQLHAQREHTTIVAEITKLGEGVKQLQSARNQGLAEVSEAKALADEAKAAAHEA
jgi:hypothetical protein